MNKSKFQIKSGIMAAAMLLMTSNIINALFGTISTWELFSGIAPNVLIMVLTLPFMVNVVFSMLAGPIAKIISKKITILTGIAIILLAGIVALFFGKENFSYLLAASALFGVGQGLLSTLTMALPADYFEGQERASLMGLQSSFVNFGGMFLAFIGALLSGIDWIYAYLVAFATVPIFIVVLTNLPSKEPVKEVANAATDTEMPQGKGKFSPFVITVLIIDIIYGVFMFTFSANFSLFMTTYGLGTITTAGLVQTSMSGLGGIAGILYGRMFKGMKSQLATFSFVITAIGMIQMVIFGGIANVFIAAILGGFGLTCAIPTFFYNVSNNVSPSMTTIALGILNGVGAFAIFLSPNIVNGVTSIFMSEPTIEGKLIVSSIALLALAVVSFFVFSKSDKKAAV
ncbi:MFS transporter [Alkalibaculum sp. M08DMB]|uniref:MFS transporter n=1 Tax=Alkalibaculum sporogenes TaxID=2655001 RepID=A0A6A7K405_9FIRM|nr:MFS transporter [Alkalibaculum sporogenes]MPW24216.1 MFS transporter [Alkalibaculum sporogenes]